MNHLYTVIILLFCFSNQIIGQETFFIKTERENQSVKIGKQVWDGSTFFTVPSSEGFHQVIVQEKGFKDEYDFIHRSSNQIFSNHFAINVDTNIIAVVKPVAFEFANNFELEVYNCDYTSYLKDLDHNGELSTIYESLDSAPIKALIKPDPYTLVKLTNEYHNATRGRYKFYTLGKINKIRIYKVNINTTDSFIQLEIESDWSITRKNLENLPTFPHTGSSGKHVLTETLELSGNIINKALHDAAMSAMFNLLSEQQVYLVGIK